MLEAQTFFSLIDGVSSALRARKISGLGTGDGKHMSSSTKYTYTFLQTLKNVYLTILGLGPP